VLVQAILDDVQPPLGFGGIQWANLISFTGDADFAGMTDLITGIARHVPRRDMGREPFNSPSSPW
jgi:hypothetical protein